MAAREEFNMTPKQIGIPTTLSSIGKIYVVNEGNKNLNKHFPYQISAEYWFENADEIKPPKGY